MNVFLYDIDFLAGAMIKQLARNGVGRLYQTFRLVPYNSHIFYVSNINALFKAYRCPSCDTFFNRATNLERHLTIFSERRNMCTQRTCISSVKHFLTNLTLLATFIQKITQALMTWPFLILNQSVWKINKIKDTETTTWIGKYISISVSISFKLIQEPSFFGHPIPRDLVSSFIDALENWATKSKSQMKMNFFILKLQGKVDLRVS